MAEELGEKRAIGRTQLKGVLDGLVQQSKDEREGGEEEIVVDDDVEEGARDLMELPHRRGYDDSTRKRSRGRRRKRRRKDFLTSPYGGAYSLEENGERHRPHVMTLFDRKVDLAKFTPSTPLYVMCRDWMCNNPKKVDTHCPDDVTMTTGVQDGRNGIGISQRQVYAPTPTDQGLPPPKPLPTDETGHMIRVDIPTLAPPSDREELDRALREVRHDRTGEEVELDRKEVKTYREEHIKRWKTVRRKWKQASFQNQQRYSESLQVLRDMYQR